jgi:hypothetical protein
MLAAVKNPRRRGTNIERDKHGRRPKQQTLLSALVTEHFGLQSAEAWPPARPASGPGYASSPDGGAGRRRLYRPDRRPIGQLGQQRHH